MFEEQAAACELSGRHNLEEDQKKAKRRRISSGGKASAVRSGLAGLHTWHYDPGVYM